MKKFIAMLLALVMVCSLATVALAADNNVGASSSTTTVKLHKLYQITGAANVPETEDVDESAAVYPHETLKFVSVPAGTNPTTQNLEIADLAVSGTTGQMAIKLPAYTEVGAYVYTVTETAGNAQGATYSTGAITLTVLVTYNADHTALEAELYLTQATPNGSDTQTSEIPVEGGTAVAKVDTFVNEYKVGHLDVTKTVSGNLASRDQEFEMTVKFTSAKPVLSDITYVDGSAGEVKTIAYGTGWTEEEVTINVKNGETVKFYNIPDGVTYTVEEAGKHAEADTIGNDASKGYEVSYEGETGSIAVSATAEAKVTNTKDESVETGIVLDSMPYILILSVAACGLVLFTTRKRIQE